MRYLLLSVLVVCVIGVMIPNTFNAFAEPFAGFGGLDCARYTQACLDKLYGSYPKNFTYYVEPIPNWATLPPDEPWTIYDAITTALFYWSDVYPNLNFIETQYPDNADITISWVKDFGTRIIGHAMFGQFIQVGLGSDAQHETWQPFAASYVSLILTHEIGHTLGQSHSDDPNSIMYAIAPAPWFSDTINDVLLEDAVLLQDLTDLEQKALEKSDGGWDAALGEQKDTQEPHESDGGCLIATATFGSEMAPQVQFLRELRDNTVLQTESGTSFMTGFNQFYYSFSPYIADYERENPAFKEAV